MKHNITKYTINGIKYAEAWLQVDILGKNFCFWNKRIVIGE